MWSKVLIVQSNELAPSHTHTQKKKQLNLQRQPKNPPPFCIQAADKKFPSSTHNLFMKTPTQLINPRHAFTSLRMHDVQKHRCLHVGNTQTNKIVFFLRNCFLKHTWGLWDPVFLELHNLGQAAHSVLPQQESLDNNNIGVLHKLGQQQRV